MAKTTPDTGKLIRTKHPGIYRKGNRYQVRTTVNGKMTVKSFEKLWQAKDYKANLRKTGPTSSIPFSVYADRWIESYQGRRAGGVSDATRDAYRDSLDRFAKPFFRREKLDRIGPKRIAEWLDHLHAQGLSPNSIRKYHAPVKALFATAVAHELITTNPTREIPVAFADPRPKTPDWLSPEQTAALLAHIPAEHGDLVYLMATTGLRISEALGLRWREIGQLDGKPSLTVAKSKTRAGERAIYLSPETARRLTARRASVDLSGDDDFVFPTKTGTQIDPRNWRRRVFSKAAEDAGLPWATPHSLRHGLASLMASEGRSAAEIASHLGHADGGVLALRTYVHAKPSEVDFVDAALKG